MTPVTYSLKLNSLNSEEYYRDVRWFTDGVLQKADESITPIVDEYIKFINDFKLEDVREKEEYIFELLSFGILWRTYANTALAIKHAPFIMLSKMGEWRKKHQRIKPFIDFSRGILISLFLLPEKFNHNNLPRPTLEQIDHVCKWFEATGEFREEALRFIGWRAYWGMLDDPELVKVFSAIAEFRNWFEIRSNEVLGKYTFNVEEFISATKNKYRWREDRISCTRKRVEYHLNMVGAELMNRAFRNEFVAAEKTSVLLPGCMRARTKNECEAAKEPKGLKCIGCEPKCRVNQIRLAGQKKNFEVYVIPHASDLSLWSAKKGEPSRGVIASACVTTLVEGGWELKRYGIPAQCVLLEYSGCKKHWHPEGVQTAINFHELERIIAGRTN
ncbi:MAG: DUF116 domain-containing protein [Bacteroidota bacterium]